MPEGLTPEKALIFRIVHRDNVPWILENGLHCKNSKLLDPNFVEIGNKDLISRRDRHPVRRPPGGTLSDYIPFYFTPFSPMLFNIRTGWGGIRQRNNDEIVIMVSSLRTLRAENVPFLFTDRHAYLVAAQFYSDLAHLDQIDWDMLQRRDFSFDPTFTPFFPSFRFFKGLRRRAGLLAPQGAGWIAAQAEGAASASRMLGGRAIPTAWKARPTSPVAGVRRMKRLPSCSVSIS